MKSCRFLFNSMSPFSRKKVYGGEIVVFHLDWYQGILGNPAHQFAILGGAIRFRNAFQHPTLILFIAFTVENAMGIFVDFPLFQIFIGKITIDETVILLSGYNTPYPF